MMISIVLLFITVNAILAVPIDERIVGGELAELGDFPYIVSLHETSRKHFFCGGSILSEQYVLTAAHCIVDFESNPGALNIQYGQVYRKSDKNRIKVEKIVKHTEYKPHNGYLNDLAILKLSEKIKLSDNAKAVKLPNSLDGLAKNTSIMLAGWGKLSSELSSPRYLYKVKVVLFSHEYCKKKVTNYYPEYHLCAGVPEGGMGQCRGDSGGPLVVDGIQYGVISWSRPPCASARNPGVSVNLAKYRDWIKKEIEILNSK